MACMDLRIEGIEADLSVRRCSVREAMSRLFEVTLTVRSHAADLDLDIASRALAHVSLGASARRWSGLVQQITQKEVEPTGLSTYELTVVPRLAILADNKDYRIFQRRTAVDVLIEILETRFIDHELRLDLAAFPSLEYRVQYGESDYAFLSRLAEEAGISFFFEYREERGSVLVLADDPSSAPPRPGQPLPYQHEPSGATETAFVTRISLHREKSPPPVVLRDVDFRRPGFPLYGEAHVQGIEGEQVPHYDYAPGSFRVYTMHPPSAGAPQATPKAPGRHDPRAGRDLAERRALAERVRARRVTFETNALDLAPGAAFAIGEHPHPWLFPPHLLLLTDYTLDAEHDKEWRATGEAVFTEPPYKPLATTKRPVVQGLQAAIVQGPEGRDVASDEYGRIKVRFFWSRLAGEESCWLRVAQGWAGPGYGLWTIPRVGQEVLVGFLEGNPDEPIIVAQLPNAVMPAPYPLPANQTKTVLRTRSTGEGDGHNEISFEDLKGQELFYQRAERDKETLVRGDERELVGGDRLRLGEGGEHVAVKGDRHELVYGDEHKTVEGDVTAKVGGAVSLTIGGDLNLDVHGTVSLRVGGEVVVVSVGKLLLAAADAAMQSGGAFVRATAGAVYASPFVENAGVGGSGAPNAPAMPAPPVLPGAYEARLPEGRTRLPVLGWIGGIPPVGSVPDEVLICRFICECKDARRGDGVREPQQCFIRKIRLYEQAARGTTHIWSEVPYDMSMNPPTPIMSRNEPWRQTGRKPAGSKIPDLIIVKDPTKPPTQDNIEKIIEIKFPDDPWRRDQLTTHKKIAGGAPVEEWGVDKPCYCSDQKEKERVRVPATDAVLGAAVIAAVIVVLLLDDVVGGFADDVAIPPLIVELVRRLGPLFAPKLMNP